MIHRLVPLLILLLAVAALAEKRAERLIAADMTSAGELVTATLRGTDRIVFSTRKGDRVANHEVELVGLSGDDEVVQARMGPWGDSHYVALVLRRGETCTYHYAVRPAVLTAEEEHMRTNPFPQLPRYRLYGPIFESVGEPYRIVSAACPGGDSIEVVFQRGWADSDPRLGDDLAQRLAQRIYHNGRPGAGLPAGALWDVTDVRAVPR